MKNDDVHGVLERHVEMTLQPQRAILNAIPMRSLGQIRRKVKGEDDVSSRYEIRVGDAATPTRVERADGPHQIRVHLGVLTVGKVGFEGLGREGLRPDRRRQIVEIKVPERERVGPCLLYTSPSPRDS